MRLFDHIEVYRGFNHAKYAGITPIRLAPFTDRRFRIGITAFAMPDPIDCRIQRKPEPSRTFTIMLQEVVGHALG